MNYPFYELSNNYFFIEKLKKNDSKNKLILVINNYALFNIII